MSFQQLSTIIPCLKDVTIFENSQNFMPLPDCHAILIVKQGHVTVTSDNQPSIICTEGFAFHAKEGPYCIEIPKTKSAKYALITYHIFPENQDWALSGPLYSISGEKIDYMLDELVRIRTLSEKNKKQDEVQSFRERLILERILFIYLYESGVKKEQKTAMSFIEETVSYLNQHYMLEIKLPMLAERAGLSVGHYTVLFKKHTGTTVTAYLMKLRIEKAKQYLLQSNLTAKEVAQRVGFSDYFHFSRSFKKEEGCSPTIFRAQVNKI
ncbi:helix-turn-helix transcriptional regulator [Domibacillus mangrovi]|uniref:AraC family transcriptional regulator n=1 Tax=Domibacillus mangrovi TaxID=1714354 RepID=A0A1Q5P1H2_9BACI|nr:AraC family transcriptional regulator [Domibacillus mangrovi]OKL36087.1 AraC family transcriptional regulator [Domibacillus mangrovi]